ncbi:hypothetical protein [Micropruina sonneratiae]|uniref:hypothetical protein n=1 Tax=Micropruina sonneratiae TaxID=2986940 RepID=UPI0022266755|nr:hypothetical protein [Micropruina sp. KQZ13P-5]MCW3157174.1 hypothetical protein [Micropruina sp. KQZ13P-5]
MSQNNQYPGQGGQQNPQGGQQYPQQGGQQFPQQGGQQYPQQGGQQYPQQGGQFPQQGGQQYPQQGGQQYPQQGAQYPQQGGQQYPAAGASGQFGQRPPGGGYGGGFQPQPAKPKSNGVVIGIVVAGIAAVALLGWLLMTMFGGGNDPDPTPTPTVSTQTTDPGPSPTPTETTSTDPSPSPTTSTSTPAGSAEVGLGVSVAPADGWQQTSRNELKNYTELSNGKALLATQAFRVEGNVTGKDIVTAYMKQITENMTGVSSKDPATMDVKNERLSVGIGSWAGTRATSQGSVKLQYVSIISVRDDGLAVMSTLIVPSGTTVASQQDDYLAMTNSLLSSQLKA